MAQQAGGRFALDHSEHCVAMGSNDTPLVMVRHNGGHPLDRKLGRPSSYTPEVVGTLFDRLAAGESLSAMCRDPGLPSRRGFAAGCSPFPIEQDAAPVARPGAPACPRAAPDTTPAAACCP